MKTRKIKNHYKAIVIGGGITGSGIFRDLSLHGIDSLLIDAKDYFSQTSSASSKMLHGGIRYLENFDFELVYEALHEKNFWLKQTPHLCYEEAFHLPIFKESKHPLWMLRIGLFLYDLLSGFKNSKHYSLNSNESLKALPGLKSHHLKGCGVYYDSIVKDDQLTLEVLLDAKSYGNQIENYIEFLNLEYLKDRYQITAMDTLTNETFKISCDYVIFATGPFTDKVLSKQSLFHWEKQLIPSKGSHLWLKRDALKIDKPMVLNTSDERIIFVIPQRDTILVGTTETKPEDEFFDCSCTREEYDYLLKNINDYFPQANIDSTHVLGSFAGIRPLVKDSSNDRSKVARTHKTYYPLERCYVILGGKYTTFRIMGQEITQNIVHRENKIYNSDFSKKPLQVRSVYSEGEKINENVLRNILEKESVKTFEDLIKRRLWIRGRNYWQQDDDFNNFFTAQLELLNRYFSVSEADISTYDYQR